MVEDLPSFSRLGRVFFLLLTDWAFFFQARVRLVQPSLCCLLNCPIQLGPLGSPCPLRVLNRRAC